MKAVIQRVKNSTITVEGRRISEIGEGLLVLIGVAAGDESSDADYLADKIVHLRIFEDDKGKMNRSLIETKGEMLIVSQFTLLADCIRGRRPSFTNAAPPEKAEQLYQYFIEQVRRVGVGVKTGIFRAMMDVGLINDGPVTIIIESR